MGKVFNIKQFAFDYNIPQAELSEVLNLKQPQVSLLLNGKRKIQEKHEKAMRERYGSIVDPYFGEVPIPIQGVTIFPTSVVEEIRDEVRKELDPKREDVEIPEAEEVEIKETIVLSPEVVNRVDYDIKQEYELGTLEAKVKPTQDVVPPHNMKVYTENDEMEPEIGANDPIFVSFMQSPHDVIAGRMYFVDLYQGAVVRWVYPQPDGKYLLRAANAATPELCVDQSDIKSVSKVVAILKRPKSMPMEQMTLQASVARKDDQMDELLTQQGRLIGIIEKKI